jgi:hypothetical protein
MPEISGSGGHGGKARLDEVLHQVVGPFLRAVRQREPGSGAYLWTLRSGEGGEHLKVRLHGPEPLANPGRALLRQAAAAFFHGEPAAERPAAEWTGLGAVELSDEDASHRPDRSLHWTHYRRSHVWLGGGPFLDDDGYVSRITRCLAAACERVLLLEPDASGKIPHRVRQSALLAGLTAGLAVSGFTVDARSSYLAYHRDTLLRSRARTEAGRAHDLLQLFERRVEAMGSAADALRQTVRSAWTRPIEAEPEGVDAAWCRALANLVWYIRPLCEDPDYRIDPLAEDPCFVPVFKAFHGFANQLGLNLVEEAFAHHFLWSVTAATVQTLK